MSTFPSATLAEHPAVTAAQMREVDRITTDVFGIVLPQMMENAGRALADVAIALFAPQRVTVLAGPAGNGGGGLVAARHLANRGVEVAVALARADVAPEVARQRAILQRMGVPLGTEPAPCDLVIDALLGYRGRGDPRGRVAELVGWTGSKAVLALDIPTGIDPDDGRQGTPSVRAAVTLTLAAPKTGLLQAPAATGDLYLADVSVPPAAFAQAGLTAPAAFASGPVVRLAPQV